MTGTDDALGKPQGSDERHGKRDLRQPSTGSTGRASWPRSRTATRARALAEAAPDGAAELEQITDFISTRTS